MCQYLFTIEWLRINIVFNRNEPNYRISFIDCYKYSSVNNIGRQIKVLDIHTYIGTSSLVKVSLYAWIFYWLDFFFSFLFLVNTIRKRLIQYEKFYHKKKKTSSLQRLKIMTNDKVKGLTVNNIFVSKTHL